MGKLSEYRSKTILPTGDTSFQQRAAITDRGNQAIARGVSELGQRLVQADIVETRIRNQNYINESSTKMERHFNEYQQEMLKTMRQDPDINNPGRREVYKGFLNKEYRRFVDEQIKSAPTEKAAESFTMGAEATYNNLAKGTDRNFESTLIETSNIMVDERAKESKLKAYRSPGFKTLDLVKSEIDAASQVYNDTMDPRLAEAARRKHYQEAAASMLDGYLDRGLVGSAEKALKSKKLDDELGAELVSRYQKRINAAKKSRKAKAADLGLMKLKDPWGYLKKVDGPPPQVDVRTSDGWNQLYNYIEAKNKQHGINLSMLTPTMKYYMSNNFQQLEPQNQREFLKIFNETRPEVTKKMAKELSVINPVMSGSMMLLSNRDDKSRLLVDQVLQGYKLTKKNPDTNKPSVPLPDREEISGHVISYLNGVTDDKTYIDSVSALVFNKGVADAVNSGKSTDKTSSGAVRRAMREIVGPRVRINNSVLFGLRETNGDFLEEGEMKTLHNRISKENLQKTHGSVPYLADGSVADIDGHQGRFEYEIAGDGKYFLYLNIGGNKQPLFTEGVKGQYKVDFRKLRKNVKFDKSVWESVKDWWND